MATFPGAPPNPLGFKCELLLGGVWTDITAFVLLRDQVNITGMGRADESGSITASQLTFTVRNDGRFTPKNSGGAYYPNIVRNCQVRVSVNATSVTSVAYSGYRFWGEVSSWPPAYDNSQRDTYVQITASGIWRRISQASVPIGSCFWRYVQLLTGGNVPAAYWAMEDGSSGTGLNGFVLSEGTGTNMTVTSAPSYAADGTSFLGSNALPQPNGARMAGNVTMSSTPSSFAVWFAVSVPAAGDSGTSQYTTGGQLVLVKTAGTVATVIVNLTQGNQLNVSGQNSGGTVLFTGTIPTKVNGTPVLCSYEQTGGAYALKIIKPGAGAVLDQVTASGFSWTVGKVTQVQVNSQGKAQDTTIGQITVIPVSTSSIVTAAGYIGGQAGELAATRISRICAESNIPLTLIGSGGAAMGPQVSDTMASVLQSIEDTDGGMLFETAGQFGLGYRTLASMQNQAAALTVAYSSGAIGAPLAGTYDDALVRNQWTVSNLSDGYSSTAQLNTGAMSIAAPPSGVGQGYAASKTINANTHAQVDAIAQQLLKQGTVDDVRYPTVMFNFLRAQAAPFFASVPGLRPGDFFQISGLPAFLGGGTAKQLAWGWSETFGGSPEGWTITFNTIPELPFETSFSPGSFTVAQGAAGGVPQGSSVGSTVNGSQVGPGTVGSSQAAIALSARSVGGITQFVAAATPYKWSFAVTGTPADVTYFICTPDQAAAIAVGDTFSSTAGLGSPFTVTQIDQASAGTTTVHYTPDATAVMSSGTVRGGTNGDQWCNSSAGNQISQWSAGVWNVLKFDGTQIINAATITTNEIAANTITAGDIAAGTVVAGFVNGTTITGATLVAYGASGDVLVYSGTPAVGNLIGSWSGAAGNDGVTGGGNNYPAGLAVEKGALVLYDQASPPSAVSGASGLYTSSSGRLRYLNSMGIDMVVDRSNLNLTNISMGTQTIAQPMSQPLSYIAGEAQTGSEYEIEIDGTLTTPTATAAATYNWSFFIDGSGSGISNVTIGTTMLATGLTIAYTVRARLTVNSTGAGGTCDVIFDGGAVIQKDGASQFNLGNMSPTGHAGGGGGMGSTPLNQITTGKALDTTVNHTFQIYGNWSSTTGTGHSAITYRTKLTRRN